MRLTYAAVREWISQVRAGYASLVVEADLCRGSTSRASGHEIHGGDHGGGSAGAEDGRADVDDDGDADLPPLGPQGPPDPPPPVHSLPELACPLSPSPLAHCELKQIYRSSCRITLPS